MILSLRKISLHLTVEHINYMLRTKLQDVVTNITEYLIMKTVDTQHETVAIFLLNVEELLLESMH